MNVGYVRTSKKEQNPNNQILLLTKEGIQPEHIFVDAGVSGTIIANERPGFHGMMDFIEKNQVEKIYLFEVSRLGRTFLDTLNLIISLEKRGIRVWSLSPQESWTRTDSKSIRELLMSVFAWAANIERDSLVERTKAGQARARSEGKHIGRPFRKIPWKQVDEYLGKGLTLSGISRLMDIPYSTLVKQNKQRKAD